MMYSTTQIKRAMYFLYWLLTKNYPYYSCEGTDFKI